MRGISVLSTPLYENFRFGCQVSGCRYAGSYVETVIHAIDIPLAGYYPVPDRSRVQKPMNEPRKVPCVGGLDLVVFLNVLHFSQGRQAGGLTQARQADWLRAGRQAG